MFFGSLDFLLNLWNKKKTSFGRLRIGVCKAETILSFAAKCLGKTFIEFWFWLCFWQSTSFRLCDFFKLVIETFFRWPFDFSDKF